MEYKLGRLPGKIPVGLHDLTYYRAGSLPTPPVFVNVPLITDWGMDGNDQYGDCGVAGLNHGFMVTESMKGSAITSPTAQAIVDYYLGYTLGQDNGVVLSDFLQHVEHFGFFNQTLAAYAPVQVHEIPTIHFAINAYGFTYTGIMVTQNMMDAFQSPSCVWDMPELGGANIGGHCVPLVGYDSRYLYCVTWGRVVPITYSAWHYMSDEAWAVIPGEFANDDGRGINIAALKADLPQLILGS